MAQSDKIEPLSNHFVIEFKRLQKLGKIGKLKEIAPLLGFKGSSGLSEILGGRSNIQPDQWEKFRTMYNLSEFSDKDGDVPNSDANAPLFYDGSLTVRDLINEKEARRKESQERAVIAEREKERLMTIIEASLNQLTAAVSKIGVANSTGNASVSESSVEESVSQLGHEERKEEFLDIKGSDSTVKKGNKKGNVAGERK